MLLTLSTQSLAKKVSANGEDFSMLDVPDYTIRQLQLRGLSVSASMLSGWSLEMLDQLRDRADKAACPCLVLVEDKPLPLGAPSDRKRQTAFERVERLGAAANRLGCNGLAIKVDAPDTDEAFERVADEFRKAMRAVERQELNILLMPHDGLTQDPDRLTELIKRVGGFRIGSLPTFAHAESTGNAAEALRKLAPYAGAIHASVGPFTKAGKHSGCDLKACVAAIRAVGFVNTLAIEFTGTGDPIASIEQAREQLQAALDAEVQ